MGQVTALDWPQFCGPSYNYKDWPLDCQECINFECIKVDSPSASSKFALVGTPGCKHIRFRINGSVVESLPTDFPGHIRGVHRCAVGFGGSMNAAIVVVASESVYEIAPPDEEGVCEATLLGKLSWLNGDVTMADGGGEFGSAYPPKLLISDGASTYCVNMENKDFYSLGGMPVQASCLDFMDGRIFACGLDKDTGVPNGHVYWSDINDPETWDPTNFVSAATTLDPTTSLKVVGNSLWVFGPSTYEIWQTTTSTSTLYSPIKKVSGGAFGVGTPTRDSVAAIADKIFFVGSGDVGNSRIYMGSGTTIKPISTDALEMELASYSLRSDVKTFCYSEEGLTYFVCTFLDANITWVYNVESESWHRRATRTDMAKYNHWVIHHGTFAWDRILCGGMDDTKLYWLSRDFYDDDGNRIVRKRVTPHIMKTTNKLMRHMSLQLKVECGNAPVTGQGSEGPQVMLRALDDYGRKPREPRWKSTGVAGEYGRRVKWYRLGTARDRAYQIEVSDPVRWMISGAVIEVDESTGGV